MSLPAALPEHAQDLGGELSWLARAQDAAQTALEPRGRRLADGGDVRGAIEQETEDGQVAGGAEDGLLGADIGVPGQALSGETGGQLVGLAFWRIRLLVG